MDFILASSSPRRRELLASLGIPFTIIKPDIDETQHPGETPLDYVARLSREKAGAVQSAEYRVQSAEKTEPEVHPVDKVILAADTVVILGADTLGVDEHGDVLGKPADAHEARDMLRQLRGRTHQVCTAMTLVFTPPPRSLESFAALPASNEGKKHQTSEMLTRLTCTDVTMRGYTDAEIDAYIATGDPFDKAGSYAIQHPVFQPVARIDGCYTNVVGLPVCTLKHMLAEIGWPGFQSPAACDCSPPLD